MRLEIEPARTIGHDPSSTNDVSIDATTGATGRGESGWSDDELARLRSEWDAEPGHR